MGRHYHSSSVSIHVDIDEFDTETLIRALCDRKRLSEAERDSLLARKEGSPGPFLLDTGSALDLAVHYAQRGNLGESLIYLTREFPDLYPLEKLARPS